MTERIIPMRVALVPPETVDAWQAAIAVAVRAGALRGVLIYETKHGIGREPVECGVATIEGLCGATLRDIVDSECG